MKNFWSKRSHHIQCYQCFGPRCIEELRGWKEVCSFLGGCRFHGNNDSHYCFCKSAQHLQSSRSFVWPIWITDRFWQNSYWWGSSKVDGGTHRLVRHSQAFGPRPLTEKLGSQLPTKSANSSGWSTTDQTKYRRRFCQKPLPMAEEFSVGGHIGCRECTLPRNCQKLSITITFGASIAVWFMKISVISDCTVWSFVNMVAEQVWGVSPSWPVERRDGVFHTWRDCRRFCNGTSGRLPPRRWTA